MKLKSRIAPKILSLNHQDVVCFLLENMKIGQLLAVNAQKELLMVDTMMQSAGWEMAEDRHCWVKVK